MKTDFTKGIYTNTKPVNTPPGYYTDAENIRVSGQSKRTEEGNTQTGVPSNFIQWGSCSIGSQSILLGTISGKSIIGSLDVDGTWVVEVGIRATDVLAIHSPTQVEGKKNWAGDRIIYFSTPTGARRIDLDNTDYATMPDEDFSKVTSLFLEYDLPRVNYVGESNSGTLHSGVYQLAARLVTDSLAPTSFGIVSSIIPVVSSSITGARHAVKGNPPQTPTTKAIEVRIDNIDTTFKYVEVGVLTYVGLSNSLKITKSVLISTNGQSSITFTYRGAADDAGDLTPEEFIISGVSYASCKFVAQKDGHLLLGAPTEADQPDINWFRVAENIVSRYVIKTIPFKESLSFTGSSYIKKNPADMEVNMRETSTDNMNANPNPPGDAEGYADPMTCTLYKGYRRDEVYSFTMTPVFISGVHGPTIHIPAQGPQIPTVEANPNDGGLLGRYESTELYPDDRYTDLHNRSLRLHKMPSAKQQPIIEGNVRAGSCKIRVLGVEFSNIELDPSEVEYTDQIAGFIIGRVDRRGQETQLAQGIVRPNINTGGEKAGDRQRTISIGDSYVTWEQKPHKSYDRNTWTDHVVTSAPDLRDFTFLAPDFIHNLYSPTQASHIKQHGIYEGDPYAAPMAYNINKEAAENYAGFSRHNCAFHNILGEYSGGHNLVDTETLLESESQTIAPFGVSNATATEGGRRPQSFQRSGAPNLRMSSTNGMVWFGATQPINYYRQDFALYHAGMEARDSRNKKKFFQYLKPAGYKSAFVVHTTTRKNTKQYGPLDQMVSMFVDYVPWKNFSGSAEFFNGDTFINKYGMTISDEANDPYNDSGDTYWDLMHPQNANFLVYFWLESDNNYAYRHFIESESYGEQDVSGAGNTVPFYPAYKQLMNHEAPFGLLTMHAESWQRPGYCKTYNTQYSTQPTVKPYVNTPPEDIERRGSLVNRIPYSVTAVQGEKADAYQIFLPNNYYDVPQEYGELTDVYVNKELFASTAQVQWRLFFNTLTTQATSAGEVVLGTGGAFNRPAVPMATVDGGYAGNTHWLHAINTVWGRVIVDKRQGKFFIMQENLAVISQSLRDTLRLDIQKLSDAVSTILVGSEPLRERVFIKIGNDMYTYNLERKMFVSRHTWKPRWFFSHGPFLYSNKSTGDSSLKTGIFKHGEGITGEFYADLHESSITVVANGENTVSKLFQAIELQTKRTTEEGFNIPFRTWDRMSMANEERYTGENNITPHINTFQVPKPLEVLSSKVKDCFRVIVPRDIVVDPAIDIFAPSNHAQHKGDTVLTPWLPKMRGTYLELKLITDNKLGPLFFYDVTWSLSQNIR